MQILSLIITLITFILFISEWWWRENDIPRTPWSSRHSKRNSSRKIFSRQFVNQQRKLFGSKCQRQRPGKFCKLVLNNSPTPQEKKLVLPMLIFVFLYLSYTDPPGHIIQPRALNLLYSTVVLKLFFPLTPLTIFADFCPSRGPPLPLKHSSHKKAYNNKSKTIICAYNICIYLYMTGTSHYFACDSVCSKLPEANFL